ncbi:WD40/YVTN/BNR-like repeat-containing protein [Fervidobacterium sp.]
MILGRFQNLFKSVFFIATLIVVTIFVTSCSFPVNGGNGVDNGNSESGSPQIRELWTEKGVIKVTIKNGLFLEDPTVTSIVAGAPLPGYHNPYGTIILSAQLSSGDKMEITIQFPNPLETQTKLYYYTGNGWTHIYINYQISNNTLSLELLDNSIYDKDSRSGFISTNLSIFTIGVGETRLKNWKLINSNDDMISVAYRNGLFVAVASYNQRGVYTSADGQSFVLRRLMFADRVLAANDMFILKRSSDFWHSSDGRNWSEITQITGALSLTKYKPTSSQQSVFVALLNDGIYHSVNGIEWTKQAGREVTVQSYGNEYTGLIERLEYGNTGGDIVLGSLKVGDSSVNVLSLDGGKTWFINNMLQLSALDAGYINNICVRISNPLYEVEIYQFNTNAAQWERIDKATLSFIIEHIYVIDDRFVAVGKKFDDLNNCYIAVSSNGRDWSEEYQIPESFYPDFDNIVIKSNGSVYVFYSLTRSYILSGSSVIQIKSYPYDIVPMNIRFLQGKFWLVHKQGLLTSVDGENWTSVSELVPQEYLTDIAYGNGVYVVASLSNKIYRSVDGLGWEEITVNLPESYDGARITKIIFAKNKFLGIGTVFSNRGAIPKAVFVSDNALSWDVIVFHYTNVSEPLNDVIYSQKDDKFIVVGNNQTMITSADGQTWERVNANQPGHYINLIYAGGKYVLITGTINSGTNLEDLKPSLIYFNGELYSGGLYLQAVTYAEEAGVYVAAGGGYEDHQFIALSRDGLGWEFIRTYVNSEDRYLLNGYIKALAYGNKKVVALGDPGLILVAQAE